MTALPPHTEKKLGLVIDLDTCVGCHACATSCKEWNATGYSAPLTDQDNQGPDPHRTRPHHQHREQRPHPVPRAQAHVGLQLAAGLHHQPGAAEQHVRHHQADAGEDRERRDPVERAADEPAVAHGDAVEERAERDALEERRRERAEREGP